MSRSSHGVRRYCFIYREHDPDILQFSLSSDNCDRTVNPGITGELVFNATIIGKLRTKDNYYVINAFCIFFAGKCVEISSRSSQNQFRWTLCIIPLLHLILEVTLSHIIR